MNTLFLVSYIVLWALVVLTLGFSAVIFRQLGVLIMGSARSQDEAGIARGKRLPDEPLSRLGQGGDWRPSDMRGQPFIFFFGASYCKECRQLLPKLREVQAEWDVPIVYGLFGDADKEALYAKRIDLPGTVVVIDQDAGRRFDVEAIPFSFAVDSDGVVLDKGLANSLKRIEALASSCRRVARTRSARRPVGA